MKDQNNAGGLHSRRNLLRAGTAGATTAFLSPLLAEGDNWQPWQTETGAAPSEYGSPSRFSSLKREGIVGHPFGYAAGVSSTPLQALNGIVTPNSLHFERHHSGIPDIDPAQHNLTIHGDVDRALRFSYEDLLRYPLESHLYFLECSGNSYRNTFPEALDLSAGELNGLLSCSEWTGVPLHHLLAETGVAENARWVIATGADASGTNRSVPLSLALDNVMVALYQNGEPLRPAQGFPMRLFVPGCEGNISIKWLTSLKLQEQPAYTREETSKYTDLLKDGTANMFSLRMAVKSVITSPSGTMTLPGQGVYEISGLAWSGHGAIRAVQVSADGGKSWAEAQLQSEPGDYRPSRFRIPWRFNGTPAVLQSRAIDSTGTVQPSRRQAMAPYSAAGIYHYNGIQSWQVSAAGQVSNVYA